MQLFLAIFMSPMLYIVWRKQATYQLGKTGNAWEYSEPVNGLNWLESLKRFKAALILKKGSIKTFEITFS